MFLNDIEEHLELNGFKWIDMYTQNGLDSLFIYCQRWKLKINDMKTKMFSEKVASWHGICSLHLTGNVLK